MGGQANETTGPNFRDGLPLAELSEEGHTLGHVDGAPVLVVRRGAQTFAVGATCSHYGGPLAEGWIEGDTVRCPWHHACFSLRTGEALGAPALNPIDCFNVEERDGKLYVLSKKPIPQKKRADRTPENIVIVGGGAAAQAASEMLRREGYAGRLTLISARRGTPRRSPEPLQRLPRGHRARRMDSASPAGVLCRAGHRAGARLARLGDRCRSQSR